MSTTGKNQSSLKPNLLVVPATSTRWETPEYLPGVSGRSLPRAGWGEEAGGRNLTSKAGSAPQGRAARARKPGWFSGKKHSF